MKWYNAFEKSVDKDRNLHRNAEKGFFMSDKATVFLKYDLEMTFWHEKEKSGKRQPELFMGSGFSRTHEPRSLIIERRALKSVFETSYPHKNVHSNKTVSS